MSSPTPHPRIAAIIPVGTLEGAKTRLGGTIDAEERHDLVEGMAAFREKRDANFTGT